MKERVPRAAADADEPLPAQPDTEHQSPGAIEDHPRDRHRVRGLAAGFLVVFTALVLGVATTGLWLRVNTLKTDRFVALLAPLGSDPDVQVALGDYATGQLEGALDTKAFLQGALPPRARVLAVPLSAAVNNYLADRVHTFLMGSRFKQLWDTAVRRAHEGVLAVLENQNSSVTVEHGQVVLNLIPLYNAILTRVETQVSSLLGRDVKLPAITPGMLPAQARQRIENAIGRPLPSNWGTVVVFEADRLSAMQNAVQLFKRLTAAVAVAGVLLIGLTIWVSPRRRRTVLQLALAIGLVFVLFRRVAFAAQDQVLGTIKVPENERAAANITHHVLSGFFGLTAVILWLCAGVALIALLAGPSRVAVAVRSGAVGLTHGTAGAVRRTGERATSADWVRDHREAIQVGIAVIGALWVLIAKVTFWQLLLVAGVVALVEVLFARTTRPELKSPPPGDVGPA